MSLPQHLLYRKGWYYFRRRIPQDLTTYFPRKELRKALKTKNQYLARSFEKELRKVSTGTFLLEVRVSKNFTFQPIRVQINSKPDIGILTRGPL